MHKFISMIFVGAHSIYTRVILANEKYVHVCMIFCGGAPGGAPRICGGHVPPQAPPPHSYAPALKQNSASFESCLSILLHSLSLTALSPQFQVRFKTCGSKMITIIVITTIV